MDAATAFATPPAAAPQVSACEWIRIYAFRLAVRRPEMCPQDAVQEAIRRFPSLGHLSPEQAVVLH